MISLKWYMVGLLAVFTALMFSASIALAEFNLASAETVKIVLACACAFGITAVIAAFLPEEQ